MARAAVALDGARRRRVLAAAAGRNILEKRERFNLFCVKQSVSSGID